MTAIHSLMSHEELARAKQTAREAFLGPPLPVAGTKIWRLFHFATSAEAVHFANIPPVQVAGEFGMTDAVGGGYDGYYFY